jgi:cytochrome c2
MENNTDYLIQIARLSNRIAIGLVLIFTLLLIGGTYSFLDKNNYSSNSDAIMPWCGTSDGTIGKAGEGKILFLNNCAACHAKSMRDKLTGPPLLGSFARWKYDTVAYSAFIRNSQRMIEKKHPRAVEIWSEYLPTVMNNFPNLSKKDMVALIAYMEQK